MSEPTESERLLALALEADKAEHAAAVSAACWLGYLLNLGRVTSPQARAAFDKFQAASDVASAARKALEPPQAPRPELPAPMVEELRVLQAEEPSAPAPIEPPSGSAS